MALGAVNAFPDWHEEQDAYTGEELHIRRSPSRGLRLVAVLAAGGAALLMGVAVVWQLAASIATARVMKKAVLDGADAHIGVAATALAWLSTAVAGIVFFWLWRVNWVHDVCDLVLERGKGGVWGTSMGSGIKMRLGMRDPGMLKRSSVQDDGLEVEKEGDSDCDSSLLDFSTGLRHYLDINSTGDSA